VTEHLSLDVAPSTLFADTPARTITGIAVPTNATATKGGRTWKFAKGSVRWDPARTSIPLLAYHDNARPLGRMTRSAWSDAGLEVSFAVSKTAAGDEALQLAADGVLGLSVGLDVVEASDSEGTFLVRNAIGAECSLTPIPAFAGSVIDKVTLSNERTSAMEPDTATAAPVVVQLDADQLGTAIAQAMLANPQQQPAATGPETQPVPHAVVTREEPPYRFDGVGGKHGFIADAVASSQGDGEANQRLTEFLHETFVTQANVTPLSPPVQRPDLYQPSLPRTRPLAGLISTGTISDNTPFILPKFNTSADLVAAHVEGTEPGLGSFTATSQTITPGALSGKVELTREVWDARGNPQVDQLVWTEMLQASDEAAEARIAALLDAVVHAGDQLVAVVGVDDAAVDDVIAKLIALQFTRGGNRFTSLALASNLYTALVNAKDSTGRKLLPINNPVNADGSVSSDFGSITIGNTKGVPAWGLGTSSYLVVPGSVWQWLSAPQKLTFDVQVKSVFIGLFQYSAEAIIRTGDTIELTYAAA
jgi:phage head maturation protease